MLGAAGCGSGTDNAADAAADATVDASAVSPCTFAVTAADRAVPAPCTVTYLDVADGCSAYRVERYTYDATGLETRLEHSNCPSPACDDLFSSRDTEYDAQGKVLRIEVDPHGQLQPTGVSKQLPRYTIATFSYEDERRAGAVVDAVAQATYTYDATGLLESVETLDGSDALMLLVSYRYDAQQRQIWQEQDVGPPTNPGRYYYYTTSYDAAGRVSQTHYEGGDLWSTETRAYDEVTGRLLAVNEILGGARELRHITTHYFYSAAGTLERTESRGWYPNADPPLEESGEVVEFDAFENIRSRLSTTDGVADVHSFYDYACW